MSESSLSTEVRELRTKVGHQLGFGRDYDASSDSQQSWIRDCIVSGLRKFYWPDPDASGVSHVWSFMKPISSVTTVSGTWEYEMPGEFAGIEGDLSFVTTSTTYCGVPITSENAIRDHRQKEPTRTGWPLFAATRPLSVDGTKGQRQELILWPTPDAAYELEYKMIVNPKALTDVARFPFGGAVHAETIVESCLAVAEQRFDGAMGLHTAEFQKRLATSISQDAQLCRPETLGINRDRSDKHRVYRDRMQVSVQYNSVTY